jgi:hypothetical protein
MDERARGTLVEPRASDGWVASQCHAVTQSHLFAGEANHDIGILASAAWSEGGSRSIFRVVFCIAHVLSRQSAS